MTYYPSVLTTGRRGRDPRGVGGAARPADLWLPARRPCGRVARLVATARRGSSEPDHRHGGLLPDVGGVERLAGRTRQPDDAGRTPAIHRRAGPRGPRAGRRHRPVPGPWYWGDIGDRDAAHRGGRGDRFHALDGSRAARPGTRARPTPAGARLAGPGPRSRRLRGQLGAVPGHRGDRQPGSGRGCGRPAHRRGHRPDARAGTRATAGTPTARATPSTATPAGPSTGTCCTGRRSTATAGRPSATWSVERARTWLRDLPAFAAEDGAIPLMGRSLGYRFATAAAARAGGHPGSAARRPGPGTRRHRPFHPLSPGARCDRSRDRLVPGRRLGRATRRLRALHVGRGIGVGRPCARAALLPPPHPFWTDARSGSARQPAGPSIPRSTWCSGVPATSSVAGRVARWDVGRVGAHGPSRRHPRPRLPAVLRQVAVPHRLPVHQQRCRWPTRTRRHGVLEGPTGRSATGSWSTPAVLAPIGPGRATRVAVDGASHDVSVVSVRVGRCLGRAPSACGRPRRSGPCRPACRWASQDLALVGASRTPTHADGGGHGRRRWVAIGALAGYRLRCCPPARARRRPTGTSSPRTRSSRRSRSCWPPVRRLLAHGGRGAHRRCATPTPNSRRSWPSTGRPETLIVRSTGGEVCRLSVAASCRRRAVRGRRAGPSRGRRSTSCASAPRARGSRGDRSRECRGGPAHGATRPGRGPSPDGGRVLVGTTEGLAVDDAWAPGDSTGVRVLTPTGWARAGVSPEPLVGPRGPGGSSSAAGHAWHPATSPAGDRASQP